MFEKLDSSNRQIMNSCYFQQVLRQKIDMVFGLAQKSAFSDRFHFNVNRKSTSSSKTWY